MPIEVALCKIELDIVVTPLNRKGKPLYRFLIIPVHAFHIFATKKCHSITFLHRKNVISSHLYNECAKTRQNHLSLLLDHRK